MLQHVARTPVACTSLLRVASSSHCSKPWRSSDNNQYAPYTSSLHVTSSSSLRPPCGLFAPRNFFPQINAPEREREATTVATAVTLPALRVQLTRTQTLLRIPKTVPRISKILPRVPKTLPRIPKTLSHIPKNSTPYFQN
ncbi:hypothetical protein M8J75_012345 [Diaphorina citri]|nr:hypothetical protein M8J75_012345 [Diaphorina citri]